MMDREAFILLIDAEFYVFCRDLSEYAYGHIDSVVLCAYIMGLITQSEFDFLLLAIRGCFDGI